MHTLIAVQRRYLESLGKLSQAEEDTIWQVIIGQRAEVSLVKFIMLNKFVCQLVCFILIFSLSFVKLEMSQQMWTLLAAELFDLTRVQLFFLCANRLVTGRMNAGVLSQLGSAQSSCVKQQQKQHTPQVCKRKCQQGSFMALWLWRQMFSGLL